MGNEFPKCNEYFYSVRKLSSSCAINIASKIHHYHVGSRVKSVRLIQFPQYLITSYCSAMNSVFWKKRHSNVALKWDSYVLKPFKSNLPSKKLFLILMFIFNTVGIDIYKCISVTGNRSDISADTKPIRLFLIKI